MKRIPREKVLSLMKPHVDQFPIVEGTMCIEVRVPAHLAYVALLQGFVAQMTNHWAYQGDRAQRKAVAEQVNQAYVETDWGSCMNCEELTACIQPLLDAQTLQITNNILNQQQFGTQTPGVPMTGEQLEENIAAGTNPTCDPDVLWAQCLQIVQYTNQAIVDVLEQVEVATNVNELLGLVDAIPLLGFIAKALGTEAVTDTISYFQDAVLEEYQAQYTTAVERALACQLFCLVQYNCEISIDVIFGMLQGNTSSLIPEDPGDLLDLIEIFAGLDFDGTEVVDVCFYFAWATAKLAQFFFGNVIASATLEQMCQLAVNDANNDWELLCDCGWFSEMDLSVSDFGWVANPDGTNWGNYSAGNGLVSGFDTAPGPNAYQMVQARLDFASPASITRMAFDFDIVNGAQPTGEPLIVGTDTVFAIETTPAPDGTDQTYDRPVLDPAANSITIRCQAGWQPGSSSDPGGTSLVKRVRVWGLGTKPPELP